MQTNLFGYLSEGEIEKTKGMLKALKHADDTHEDWSKHALRFLKIYAQKNKKFSGEMVRYASNRIVPDPPSLRAWGAVLLQGYRKGWIRQVGYVQVDNPKAHKANAALWESIL